VDADPPEPDGLTHLDSWPTVTAIRSLLDLDQFAAMPRPGRSRGVIAFIFPIRLDPNRFFPQHLVDDLGTARRIKKMIEDDLLRRQRSQQWHSH